MVKERGLDERIIKKGEERQEKEKKEKERCTCEGWRKEGKVGKKRSLRMEKGRGKSEDVAYEAGENEVEE